MVGLYSFAFPLVVAKRSLGLAGVFQREKKDVALVALASFVLEPEPFLQARRAILQDP